MISRLTKLLFLASFFLFSYSANAQVVINEIMYDLSGSDTNREWVEIYNSGASEIDIAGWKFFEANTNHGLTVNQGSSVLSAGGYAVITDVPANFLADWSGFGGTILDNSFSLSNTGEDLAIKDVALTVVDQATYSSASGAVGDGNSLQKSGSSWIAAPPTPGATNASVSSGGGEESGGDDSGSGGSSSTTTQMPSPIVAPAKIIADIVSKTSVVAGLPVSFEAKVVGLSGEPLTRGKFLWSFGDGGGLDSADNKKFTHTYYYPGDYVVVFEYSQSVYAQAPDAIDRQTVKVLPAGVTITSFGLAPDFPVELSNSATSEIDISAWVLKSDFKTFRLPQNTLMLPSKKIILSGRLTGFTVEDAKTLKLVLPSGDLVFDYGASLANITPPSDEFLRSSGRVVSEVPPPAEQTKLAQPDTQKFTDGAVPQEFAGEEASDSPSDLENQPAAVTLALPEENNKKSVWPWLLGVVGLAGLAVAGVFMSKGVLSGGPPSSKPSDDFKLIDE